MVGITAAGCAGAIGNAGNQHGFRLLPALNLTIYPLGRYGKQQNTGAIRLRA